MKITSPIDMGTKRQTPPKIINNISNDIIKLIEDEFKSKPKGQTQYKITVPGEYPDHIRRIIVRTYNKAGWDYVQFYSEPNQSTLSLTMF